MMKVCTFMVALLALIGCDSEKQRASDRALAGRLLGTWDDSMTNTHSARFSGDVTYETNGVAHWRGTVTEGAGPAQTIDDWGVWRVQKGCLFTRVTNSTLRDLDDEPEYRDFIVSLSATQFTYRDHLRDVYTSKRKR